MHARPRLSLEIGEQCARAARVSEPSYEPEPAPPFEMPPTLAGPTLHVDPNTGEVLNY